MTPPLPTVRNCPLPLDCGQRWLQLDPIRAQSDLRFCLRCQRAVHRCDRASDADALAKRGRVVLLDDADTSAMAMNAEVCGWR